MKYNVNKGFLKKEKKRWSGSQDLKVCEWLEEAGRQSCDLVVAQVDLGERRVGGGERTDRNLHDPVVVDLTVTGILGYWDTGTLGYWDLGERRVGGGERADRNLHDPVVVDLTVTGILGYWDTDCNRDTGILTAAQTQPTRTLGTVTGKHKPPVCHLRTLHTGNCLLSENFIHASQTNLITFGRKCAVSFFFTIIHKQLFGF